MHRTFVLLIAGFVTTATAEDTASIAAESVQNCIRSLHTEPASFAACEEAMDLANDPTTRGQVASALALIYASEGALARAQEYMDQALALDPQNATVLINLGNLRIKERRYPEAVEAYARAQDFGALEEPVLYLNRSLALRALGRYGEAKADYDYFLALHSRGFALPTRDKTGIGELNSDTGVTVEDRDR